MEKLFTKILNRIMVHLILLFFILFSQSTFALDNVLLPSSSSARQENKIKSFTIQEDKNASRIIFELVKPLEKNPELTVTDKLIRFEIPLPVKENISFTKDLPDGSFFTSFKAEPQNDKVSFEVGKKYFCPVSIKQSLVNNLLIVELERNYFIDESKEIKEGVTKHFIRTECERGPIIAHALEIDLSRKNISIKVGIPDHNKIKAKETVSKLVSDENAFIGINANYFDVKQGNPLGTLITMGSWITGPVYNRVAVGFTEDNDVLIDQVKLIGKVNVKRGFRKKSVSNFDIDGLNIPFGLYKKVGYFTSDFDPEFSMPKNKEGFLVEKSCIKKIIDKPIAIPEDSYVLLPSDIYHFNHLKKKDCLDIKWESSPSWDDVSEAVSGGPYLIKDGQIFIDEKEQNFRFGKKDTYAPRSAIGIGENGKLFLIAVDGRKNEHSVGVSFPELSKILKNLNLQEAINLDGGGSTTLVLDGKIINTLSEHHERKVSTALLIFYN